MKTFKPFIDGHRGQSIEAESELGAARKIAERQLKVTGAQEVTIEFEGMAEGEYFRAVVAELEQEKDPFTGEWVTKRFEIEITRTSY